MIKISYIKILTSEITMITWIREFQEKFSEHEVISRLSEIGFHGKLEINFSEGHIGNVHVNWCVKPGTHLTLKGGADGTRE